MCIRDRPKKEHGAAKETVAYEAIKRIGAIYHLDNQLADLKPDDRRKQRQKMCIRDRD